MRMFQSQTFQSTPARQAEIFEAVFSVGLEASYAMIENGKPPLAGGALQYRAPLLDIEQTGEWQQPERAHWRRTMAGK